jgi:heavy metal sensor kinase
VNTRSIRFRLTAWYAGLMTVAILALTTLFFLHLRHYLENTLLETQLRRGQQIATTLVATLQPADESGLGAQVERLYAPERSDRFIRITRQDGKVVYCSAPPLDQSFLPERVAPVPNLPAGESVRRQEVPGAAPLLLAAVPVAGAGGRAYLVEVGISAAPVELMFRHLLALLALSLPVLVALAALGGYGLVRRALYPVERIASKAEEITQYNLSQRLPVARSGDELERLSLSLNLMIARLDDAFQQSKRFVADASHELRTPLTIVRGEIESAALDEGYAPAQRERLGGLLEEMERLSRIVEQLFALSRLDAGEAQEERVPFDLAALVAATAGQMVLLAEDRAIALAWETAAPVPVQGDRARLKQVVVNLLDNAIKYTPRGGAVRLRVTAEGGQALLEVSDNGIGVPAEAIAQVFHRFYRAARSGADHPEGAGLGLAIVKSITTAHGGTVEVTSTVGQGSCFRVRLPLAH